jgi:hypothetical protein
MRFAAVLMTFLTAGSAAAAALPEPHGWAKPNISYLQFRTDTVECGYAAAQTKMTDIVKGPPSVPTIAVTAPSAHAGTGPASGMSPDTLDLLETYVQNYQQYTVVVERQVSERVQAELDKCLKDRGYSPFRVTSDEMAHLRRLKKGTRERYQYIYSLAVDPKVLATQGL